MNDEAKTDSFEVLWRRLAPHARAAALRYRSRDAALGTDDLVQEVRIRVWEVYRGDRNSRFNASYYYKVVNSAIIDCLRAHRGTLAHSIRAQDDETPGAELERVESNVEAPDAELERRARAQALNSALDRLPKERARAVRLYLQGFTVPEIAELLGCGPDRAHNLTYRGTRALKKQMKKDQDDG